MPSLYGDFVKSMCEELAFPLIDVKIKDDIFVVKWTNSYVRLEGTVEEMTSEQWHYNKEFLVKEECPIPKKK